MNIAKGFICVCGKEHNYPVYVFAHYDVELTFTCPGCNKEYDILSGVATLKQTGEIMKAIIE